MATFIRSIKKNYKNLVALANPNRIGYIIFYVTNRCNFRCPFCFYYAEIEKGRKPNELSVDEIERIAKSTGALIQLSLTGGEPFVRKEFAEITDIFIGHTGVRFITIPTNAWLTDRMVRYLEAVLPRYPSTYIRLAFSVDGIGADHDENRAMPGSFDKIVESYRAISPLRKHYPNLVLDTNSVFMKKTEDSIIDILRYLDENFEFDNHTVTFVRGEIPNPELKSQSAERYREMKAFLGELEGKKEKRLLYPLHRGVHDVTRENLIRTVFEDEFVTPCVAGRKLVVISETGEVYPCEILGKSMGNLRDYDFDIRRLTATRANDALRTWIVETECKCSFECALAANVTWNTSMYPRLARAALKNVGRGWRNVDRTPKGAAAGAGRSPQIS